MSGNKKPSCPKCKTVLAKHVGAMRANFTNGAGTSICQHCGHTWGGPNKLKSPLSSLRWVDPKELHANDYNPNKVFGPELRLLKESLLANGWTQPVVARDDGEIVDGFHRWTLASRDPEVASLGDGCVPVVYLPAALSREEQMMATVRHNRARGQHGVLKMGTIVRELKQTLDDPTIQKKLGMEREEIDRLSDIRTSPQRTGKDSFGRGWVPDPDTL